MSDGKTILFEFFETNIKESQLFKLRSKIEKKLKELDKKNLKEEKRKEKKEELKQLNQALLQQREKSKKYEIRDWLEDKANSAIRLNGNKKETNMSLSTHPIKLTHSSISGASSILFNDGVCDAKYLSTASLSIVELDVGYPDAKLAPLGKLLLFLHNEKLIDKIPTIADLDIFRPFAKDAEQYKKWIRGFSLYYRIDTLASHFLAKQIYFPVNNDYHIISPLASSSLDQVIYKKIKCSKGDKKISKECQKSNEQRRKNKYHKDINIWYPRLAVLKVTRSNHSNASLLNGRRLGERYLFPSTPPQWNSTLKPPLNYISLFRGEYEYKVKDEVKSLQKYLLKIKDKKPNIHIRNNVRRNINWIIDTLFNYVAEIQRLKSGWSQEEGRLKESHRLWLDPYCQDELFQAKRATKVWQDEVCLDFGLWLNKKLEHKEMLFVKINSDRWAKILRGRLREFERDLEVSQ